MQTIQSAVRRTLAAAAVITVSAAAASAQPKTPDFSGQWELNTGKSDLGPAAGMITKITFTVAQTPANIKFTQAVSTVQGDQTSSQDYTLDGKETEGAGPGGMTIVRSAKFAGDTIVILGKMKDAADQGQTSRWTLAPDGKTMLIQQQISSPMGAMSMKLVFDKK